MNIRRCLLAAFALMVLAGGSECSVAQEAPCKAGAAHLVRQTEGVTVKTVRLFEPSGEVDAFVFVPDIPAPVPGIVFSHSEIRGQSRTDLKRFAFALARAGAASIVLDGTIEWSTPDDHFPKPSPHTLACAGNWMLSNENLDQRRLAFAGTLNGLGGGNTPLCGFETKWKSPCWHPSAGILNFGTTAPADSANTDAMLTSAGQMRMAKVATEQLGLSDVKPEWLTQEGP